MSPAIQINEKLQQYKAGSSDDTCNFGDDVSEVVPRDAREGSDCDENDA